MDPSIPGTSVITSSLTEAICDVSSTATCSISSISASYGISFLVALANIITDCTSEATLFQHSKADWLQKKDKNTRFFHCRASARRAKNSIKVIDGIQSIVPSHLIRFLDSKFTGEEIRTVVFNMGPLKAPGKDGLLALFFQKFWGTVGQSVISACLRILNEGGSVRDLDSTVITLIPKVQMPLSMSDFRPISLCNVMYKIIAKTITNRMRVVMGTVISETQCTFIPGWLISDNTIVGFECLHRLNRRKRKKGSLALKLDMSKAYDRVEWCFIDQIMRKFSGKMGEACYGMRYDGHLLFQA
ncbi:hypothetical protein Dsin_006248 [Dipteronia sinensis]|uniref:Reverse transcriptase domain-containing protein n=1 Tax=Dipteronia sinensis TaxID=43782 RepID=A0AAE0EFG2_9ROSI|nr:hypothetical protein Dsin_006248 [Dipteronia sinensis]